MLGKIGNTIKSRKTPNDKIYTPLPVALRMIEMCDIKPTDKVLDCSLGGGIFYNNLPKCEKYWCEIDDEIVGNDKRDFFDFTERVDLVIGNPPFSLWTKWLEHTMKITDKFCYLMGTMNLTDTRLKDIQNNGFNLTKLHILKIHYWFGHQYICIFEKNKLSIISVEPNRIYCDVCNSGICKRGSKTSYNKCSNEKCKINKIK